MAVAKRTKKNADNINTHLSLVLKSGKFCIGTRSTKKNLRSGRSKLVIVANNLPTTQVSEIEYYCLISKVGFHRYNGSNVELGTACGKRYPISVLGINDPGDSDIFKSLEFN